MSGTFSIMSSANSFSIASLTFPEYEMECSSAAPQLAQYFHQYSTSQRNLSVSLILGTKMNVLQFSYSDYYRLSPELKVEYVWRSYSNVRLLIYGDLWLSINFTWFGENSLSICINCALIFYFFINIHFCIT